MFPNLLVGLREGLEAGLVVTILVGAVRRLAPGRSLAGVWVGVTAAAVLSLSFGAVLTFTRAEMSPKAQEVFGGVTSLVAVVLVTSMIFWMRRAARGLSGELRSRVGDALAAGGAALVVTAFVSVAREGLEAALFVWTNAQAAGSSTSPLLGALIGLVISGGLCVLLYRRVLTVNLGRFFTVTGAVLVVIVAGVLAYGVVDLQDAGLLPGLNSVAFDISAHVRTGTWWTETIRGITNLDNRMTWLQVIAYVGYIAVVLPLFLWRGRSPRPVDEAAQPAAEPARPSGRRRLVLAGAALLVPAVGAGAWVAIDHGGHSGAGGAAVTVTGSSCADDWTAPVAGTVSYSVRNESTHAVDVEIIDAASQAVVAEIEVLGPGTTRDLPATLGAGSYHWKCVYSGAATTVSATRAVTGSTPQPAQAQPIKPATAAELAPVLAQYRSYVGGELDRLTRQVAALDLAVAHGDGVAARQAWLTGYLTYHRIGAAYNAFGDAGAAVDGLANGLPGGAADPDFAGFHRIELGLWGDQPVAGLRAHTSALVKAVDTLKAKLPEFTFDPNDVTIRAHEILEDTVRFVLTGQSDYGSGSGYRTAQADLDGDRALVDLLAPLLDARRPALLPAIRRDMATLQDALTAAVRTGDPVRSAPPTIRMKVNAATSQLAETLAPIPDLLEIRAQ